MEAVEQSMDLQLGSSQKEIAPQMSIGAWILTFVLLMIPLVNIIMTIIWAMDSTSQRRNFARAYIIITLIMTVLSIIFTIALIALAPSWRLFSDYLIS